MQEQGDCFNYKYGSKACKDGANYFIDGHLFTAECQANINHASDKCFKEAKTKWLTSDLNITLDKFEGNIDHHQANYSNLTHCCLAWDTIDCIENSIQVS